MLSQVWQTNIEVFFFQTVDLHKRQTKTQKVSYTPLHLSHREERHYERPYDGAPNFLKLQMPENLTVTIFAIGANAPV